MQVLPSQTNPGLPDEGVDLGLEISCIGRRVLLRRIWVLYQVRDGAPQGLLNR
jgi:hypothetical protein